MDNLKRIFDNMIQFIKKESGAVEEAENVEILKEEFVKKELKRFRKKYGKNCSIEII